MPMVCHVSKVNCKHQQPLCYLTCALSGGTGFASELPRLQYRMPRWNATCGIVGASWVSLDVMTDILLIRRLNIRTMLHKMFHTYHDSWC